ncbi:MAG: uncharacterized protein PWR13_179 [Archaeoglobi archaeon]|nr:DNA polymerase subunit beta [Candidatus Mnemosynella bozhongmuii]MDK2781151.1 uncharacterized protein [Archaeoglobi archaeon]
MRGYNPVIRDFLVTRDLCIFSVVDYRHPDERVRALLRYIPDERGERRRRGVPYRKVEFEESFEVIDRDRYSVTDVHEVPRSEIIEILRPVEGLKKAVRRSEKVRKLIKVMRGIPEGKIGVTGSYLCELEDESSDIDLVIYGSFWEIARRRVKEATLSGELEELTEEMWRRIYRKRDPEISFEEFLIHEKRKWNRGMIDDVYFDLLYVSEEPPPFYPRGEKIGRAEIFARVTDAAHSFNSPAIYRVDHPEIEAVLSYTHTYAGQALEGEFIEARGWIEELGDGRRILVVGSSRKAKGEYIKSITLLERCK